MNCTEFTKLFYNTCDQFPGSPIVLGIHLDIGPTADVLSGWAQVRFDKHPATGERVKHYASINFLLDEFSEFRLDYKAIADVLAEAQAKVCTGCTGYYSYAVDWRHRGGAKK